MSTAKTGTFIARYKVTNHNVGGPTLYLNLVVTTPTEKVNGSAEVTIGSINPPFELNTPVSGDFTYMTVMPDNTHILVVLASPILIQDGSEFTARLVLKGDWKSGVATYTFAGPNGFTTIKDAKVELVEPVTA